MGSVSKSDCLLLSLCNLNESVHLITDFNVFAHQGVHNASKSNTCTSDVGHHKIEAGSGSAAN